MITHPPLPLGQLGFLLQLEQAGDVGHFAQQQTQPHRPARHFRLGPAIGETARQQGQFELLLRVGDKTVQVVERTSVTAEVLLSPQQLGIDLGQFLQLLLELAVMLDGVAGRLAAGRRLLRRNLLTLPTARHWVR